MCALVTGVQTCALPILVECTPCLLCVDEVATNLPRVGDRLADRTRGDFGKHHPMQHLAIEQTALTQDLDDLPGNGLALAIRVSGQVQCRTEERRGGKGCVRTVKTRWEPSH